MTQPINACIFILTQNTIERKIYLKTCLYFLFKNFNSKFKYPVKILHEKDYDDLSQEEIIKSIRSSCRHLISFVKLDESDFEIPTHIDIEKVKKSVELQTVPYWRNIRYRSMCYFWVKHIWKYADNYDYIMRLDDDSIIEEIITDDFFSIVKEKNYVYASNIIHIDCGICNYGMKELFASLFPNSKEQISSLFISTAIDKEHPAFLNFKKLYEHINNKEYTDHKIILDMPLMYYNNFFVTSVAFWKQQCVKEVINEIDKHGGIFYYRYGDAPLHTLIVSLSAQNQISKFKFKYSKRLQREVFIDENKTFNTYFPNTYEETSCITDNMKK